MSTLAHVLVWKAPFSRCHATAMNEQLVQMQEVNTGITNAMEGYMFSESSHYNFRQQPFQAGPSTAVHPERQRYFGCDASSFKNTGRESTWLGHIRGGAGSDGAAGGAADGTACRAAGGVTGGAAGGAAGGAGDPAPPGSPQPSDQSNNNNNNPRQSRRQGPIQKLQYAKPIKIKEPKRFEGKLGDDFHTCWIMVEV